MANASTSQRVPKPEPQHLQLHVRAVAQPAWARMDPSAGSTRPAALDDLDTDEDQLKSNSSGSGPISHGTFAARNYGERTYIIGGYKVILRDGDTKGSQAARVHLGGVAPGYPPAEAAARARTVDLWLGLRDGTVLVEATGLVTQVHQDGTFTSSAQTETVHTADILPQYQNDFEFVFHGHRTMTDPDFGYPNQGTMGSGLHAKLPWNNGHIHLGINQVFAGSYQAPHKVQRKPLYWPGYLMRLEDPDEPDPTDDGTGSG